MPLSVLHKLKHDHRVIEQGLRALQGVCFRLACKEKLPTEALGDIVEFISRYVDSYHHGKEENCLFPLLEQHGIARGGGPLGHIEAEHKIEHQLIVELTVGVQGLKVGSELSRGVFIEAANRFITHLTNHMEQEEAILFPLAEQLLEAADGEALADGFQQAEKEFGESNLERYENLVTALEEIWAV